MSTESKLTERQQFWLDHLRKSRRSKQSLKAYAERHGLDVRLFYEAKSRLKRKGALAGMSMGSPRFVRVEPTVEQPMPAVCRVHLRNGTVVELACMAQDWERVLSLTANLP